MGNNWVIWKQPSQVLRPDLQVCSCAVSGSHRNRCHVITLVSALKLINNGMDWQSATGCHFYDKSDVLRRLMQREVVRME